LRIETVINDPNDLGVLRRIVHLDQHVGKARAVNRRLFPTTHTAVRNQPEPHPR
jgi:hypothetical protein